MRIRHLGDRVTMFQISPMDSNMYLINRGALLIDTTTGYHTALIKKALNSISLDFPDISCILNTHSHIDHIGGNHLFTNAKVMMHKSAEEYLKEPAHKSTLAKYYRSDVRKAEINIPLIDGDIIRAKGTKLEIIHTPGHTRDSISVYMPEEKFLVSGDSIPVRMDKKISCYIKSRELTEESRAKLRRLDIKTILPGHGQIINTEKQIKELLKM